MPISSAAATAPCGLQVMSMTVVVPERSASAKATSPPARASSTVMARHSASG